MKNSSSVIINFVWRFLERCGAQGVSFIVSIVIARLLDPELYGTIALITVFTSILQVFVDSGMGNALIQKKNADDVDFSSVFYFNICICLTLYMVMFFSAPLIAGFYCRDELTSIIRVLSLTIVISGVKNIQQAYVSRTMQFKRFFFATIGGTIGAAVIGIVLAYKGFGIWALVFQQLFNATVDTIILWVTVKWRPKRCFSFQRVKELFSYGWKLLISSILDTVYNDIRQLIIGKMYSSSDLSFYNRGKQMPHLFVTNINASIDSVLLPTMSKEQDNPKEVKKMTRRAMKTSTYVLAPLMMGLAFCGEPLIRILLTDKWLPSVPFMQVFCITFMFWPVHTANLNAIKAMGRSDMFLKLEIIKKIVGVILLVSSMWFGVMAMAYSLLIGTLINTIINAYPNRKLMNYSYIEQIKDIMPSILLATIMGLSVYFIKYLPIYDIFILFFQFVLGIIIYLLGSILLKIEAFIDLSELVKSIIKKGETKRVNKKIGIFGAGSLGMEILSVLLKENYNKDNIIFIDDISNEKNILGISVYNWNSVVSLFQSKDIEIIVALGEPKYRNQIATLIKSSGYNMFTFISKSSFVAEKATIGEGTVIFPNSYIGYNCSIGINTLIHFGSKIVEGSSISNNCFISLGSFIGSRTLVGEECFIGPNASVSDHLKISNKSIIGIGSVVLHDTPENSVNVGVPSKCIRNNSDGMVFHKN